MKTVNKPLAALVLGAFAAAALAAPSFAQIAEGMSGARAQALRDCNAEAAKYKQYTWGVTQTNTYRACMAKQGQQE